MAALEKNPHREQVQITAVDEDQTLIPVIQGLDSLPQESHRAKRHDRTPSWAWKHALLLVSTSGCRCCCHNRHQLLCGHSTSRPPQQWRHGTWPCLHQDMIVAIPEMGVQAPSDGGHCQAFPADPHNTFGSAGSYRYPTPPPCGGRLTASPLSSPVFRTGSRKSNDMTTKSTMELFYSKMYLYITLLYFTRLFLYRLAMMHVRWWMAQWTVNTVYFCIHRNVVAYAERPVTGV